MLDPAPGPSHQTPQARISTGIVGLLREYYGKGPEQAKTYFNDDLVVVLLRGGFTAVEETLLEAGCGEAVISQRLTFQSVMRNRFSEIIERETGRKVVAFMNGSHQDPDVFAELFLLAD
jgi:uncharacterized protein YbcI